MCSTAAPQARHYAPIGQTDAARHHVCSVQLLDNAGQEGEASALHGDCCCLQNAKLAGGEGSQRLCRSDQTGRASTHDAAQGHLTYWLHEAGRSLGRLELKRAAMEREQAEGRPGTLANAELGSQCWIQIVEMPDGGST